MDTCVSDFYRDMSLNGEVFFFDDVADAPYEWTLMCTSAVENNVHGQHDKQLHVSFLIFALNLHNDNN